MTKLLKKIYYGVDITPFLRGCEIENICFELWKFFNKVPAHRQRKQEGFI